MISQIIPIFQEDNWNEQCQIFSDNINEKLDREELEPRKEALYGSNKFICTFYINVQNDTKTLFCHIKRSVLKKLHVVFIYLLIPTGKY
jgi:hypothetical protein